MTTVQEAFRRARIIAERHMRACDVAHLAWGETTITEMVLAHASVAVTAIPFTPRAEARSGADWIWWWVDGSAAYGMLVQAKRVTIDSKRWSFNFDYRSKSSTRLQREVLVDTASALGLLPVHALYLGTGDYREWVPCPGKHRKSGCPECARRTVSLMPAVLATDGLIDDASSTYEWSVALEDLWRPAHVGAFFTPGLKRFVSPDLAEFLTTKQGGTHAVARSMTDRVLKAGAFQFSAAVASAGAATAGAHDELGSIFRELPEDTMHGGIRYWDHVLTPLTHSPPGYVLAAMTGDLDRESLQEQLPESVRGIIIIRTPRVDDGESRAHDQP